MYASTWFFITAILSIIAGIFDWRIGAGMAVISSLIATTGFLSLLEKLRAQGDALQTEVPRLLGEISYVLAKIAKDLGPSHHPGLDAMQDKINQLKTPQRHLPPPPSGEPAPHSHRIRCPDCASEFPAPAHGTRAVCPTCGVALDIVA